MDLSQPNNTNSDHTHPNLHTRIYMQQHAKQFFAKATTSRKQRI